MAETLKQLHIYTARAATTGDEEARVLVRSWIQGYIGQGIYMVPRSEEDMQNLFSQGKSMLIFTENHELAGHIAETDRWEDGTIELGAFVVNPTMRGNGAGSEVLKAAVRLQQAEGRSSKQIAFANEVSLSTFLRSGATPLDEIKPEYLRGCATCPRRVAALSEGKACCDTIVQMPQIAQG